MGAVWWFLGPRGPHEIPLVSGCCLFFRKKNLVTYIDVYGHVSLLNQNLNHLYIGMYAF